MKLRSCAGIREIMKLCLNTVGCIGFNTQGLLKTKISPFDNWTRLEHKGGFYVLGICKID